jgi:hypothetical protein
VISSREKGDRLAGSLDVKASVAERNLGQIRQERRATGQAVAEMRTRKPRKRALLETDGRMAGRAELSDLGEGLCRNR